MDIEIQKVADEIKRYIDGKKFDLIDYSLEEIQCYPSPNSDDYPETRRFSALWSEFFDEADKVMASVPDEQIGKGDFGDALATIAPELAARFREYDDATKKVEAAVNGDGAFWDALRAVVIPLYEKSADHEGWSERWKRIELSFDPCPMQAVTTQMWTNKETGERIRGEVVHTTDYPASFIVNIL